MENDAILAAQEKHAKESSDVIMPTRQALPPGCCSRIIGQVVQEVAEMVRLGPLNRTAGCPNMQGILTLAKMHV